MTVDSSSRTPLPESELSSLLAAARMGATWAWKPIYSELAPVVLRYLRASGAREPEDLLGEIFVRVVRNLADFSGGAREMRAWVLTIAHRRLVDERRHTSRRRRELLPDEALAAVGGSGDVEEEALPRLTDDRVRTTVGRLSPAQRDVFFLRLFAGLTVDEVARVVGRRPGTVQALQVRALGAIRRERARGAALPFGAGDGRASEMRGSSRSELHVMGVERLFAGRASTDDVELRDLARFFADLEEACPKASTEPCAAAHIVAMVEAAELRAADVGRAAKPTREARGLMSLASGRRPPDGGGVTRGFSVAMLTRVAVVTSLLALIFGGVAFGGALPGPLQHAVATFAQHVGIDVPWDRDGTVKNDHDKDAGAAAVRHGGGEGAPCHNADNAGRAADHGKPGQAGQAGGINRADQAGQAGGNGKPDQAGQAGDINRADQAAQDEGNDNAVKAAHSGGNGKPDQADGQD